MRPYGSAQTATRTKASQDEAGGKHTKEKKMPAPLFWFFFIPRLYLFFPSTHIFRLSFRHSL